MTASILRSDGGAPVEPIVISGLGPVSSLGVGPVAFASAVEGAKKGEPRRDCRALDALRVDDYVKLRTQCVDPSSKVSVVAAAIALDDAGWRDDGYDATRCGLVLGTAHGSQATLGDHLASSTSSPIRFVHTFINTAAGLTSQVFQLRGAHSVLCSGDLAGLQAIRYASHLLATRKADRILCGGTDSARGLPPRTLPTAPSRPFTHREGAGLLALQRAGTARTRALAVLAGYGVSSTASSASHCFDLALQAALASAGTAADRLGAAILATQPDSPFRSMEQGALSRADIGRARWLDLPSLTGDIGAALGPLSAIAGCFLLRELDVGHCVLVLGFDGSQCMALILRAET